MSTFPPIKDCCFLAGATASGKTSLGIKLAQRIDAEILSLDSIALYREMNIGTAKPTPTEQAQVPHHLINLIPPSEDYSISQYLSIAHRKADEIKQSGKRVLFVGGTPLYLKSLLRGIFEGPEPNWDLRNRLAKEAEESNDERYLHKLLSEVDLASAQKLHYNDHRRLIRAYEVYQSTHRKMSEWQEEFNQPALDTHCPVFVLDWDRETLYQRIDLRVDRMFEESLVDEVKGLLENAEPLSRTAAQAVGYREVIEYLQGKLSLEEAIQQVKYHSHQLAKRQCTWFRSLEECQMIPMRETTDLESLAEELVSRIDL